MNGKRIRISISGDRKGISTVRLCVTTFIAELIGTFILLFMGCMGEMYGFPTVNTVDMQGGTVFGAAVLVIIQVLGPVSGAHVNPAVTLAEWIVGLISLPLAISYVIAQLIGAIGGAGLIYGLTPASVMNASMKFHAVDNVTTHCIVNIHEEISLAQGFFAEFFMSCILIFFCLGCWDERNSAKQDSTPIKFALVIAALSMAGGPYSGSSMNPARAFGPAVIFNSWENHWIYWIAPLAAAIIVCLIHIFVFEAPAEAGHRSEITIETGPSSKSQKNGGT